MYVHSITVESHRRSVRCVEYCLRVSGLTKYLHPMCFYDPDSCLSQDYAVFTHWVRFRSICRLHKTLREEFPQLDLPRLPRHWFPLLSQGGIQRRVAQLGVYFATLLESVHVRHSRAFHDFFQPKYTLDLCIVGEPGVGKMRILEAFLSTTKKSMSESIPQLSKDVLQTSGVYPDRCEIPIDMIVDRSLVRIAHIRVRDSDENDADGVIFAYSEAKPSSLKPIQEMRRRSRVESAVVALDEGESISQGQFAACSCADAYMVFEYVVRRHIRTLHS